jgi:hypothetical protein
MGSIQLSVSTSNDAAVFCIFGGGGGRYVTTLAFFGGGPFGVAVLKLKGSLNFPLFASGLRLPLTLRAGGFRVDHSESGDGGSWS